MKKTIRIIDLLNKIANGEEVPKKIKYCYDIYEYSDNEEFYYMNGYSLYRDFYTNGNCLNSEVEIIEEDKKIKKLDIQSVKDNPTNMYIVNECGTKCYMTKHSREIALKVNELIDVVNDLKGKSE